MLLQLYAILQVGHELTIGHVYGNILCGGACFPPRWRELLVDRIPAL